MKDIELRIYSQSKTPEGKVILNLLCSCGRANCEHLKMTTPCKKCKKPMLWAKTTKGKIMPVDATTFESHFATCEFAKEFKSKEK